MSFSLRQLCNFAAACRRVFQALVLGSIASACLVSCGGGLGPTPPLDVPESKEQGSYTLAKRILPAIYTNGTAKAINYHPYRGAGPGTSDTPTDANILQDLRLMNAYGFNLIRLFGSDDIHAKVLDLALSTYPSMKFQLGIYLRAPSSCDSDAVNDAQINKAIALATSKSNVATVSVGNEPSLTNSALLMSCMEGYVKRVKVRVPQPITADDDYWLYGGNRNFSYGNNTYSAANFLPWLDFLSIHTYPASNYIYWWGTHRASANTLMLASLAEAQNNYAAAGNYRFTNAAGVATTVAESMPIIVGETGWKARQTNPNNALETAAAKPQNAKWYFDLMNIWQAGGAGPKTIFYFSSFDETWKGIDDGWGLWDKDRSPRYALCGSSAETAPSCTSPPYTGAGY